jgi:hypothetical protein
VQGREAVRKIPEEFRRKASMGVKELGIFCMQKSVGYCYLFGNPNMRRVISVVILVIAVAGVTYQQHRISNIKSELAAAEDANLRAEEQKKEMEKAREVALAENKNLKEQAAEVYKLRNEVTTLRKEQVTLKQQVLSTGQKATKREGVAVQDPAPNPLPAQFSSVEEMAQTVAVLRGKAFGGGGLSEEEKQYLQTLKPQIEKMEKSPGDFATFQSAMIQSATGVSDPARIEQIKSIIQKTYENANSRGLDIAGLF